MYSMRTFYPKARGSATVTVHSHEEILKT